MTEPQKTVVLIDLSSVAYPIWHKAQADVSGPNATADLTIQAVKEYSSGQPFTVVCCDSPKNFRKEIDAEYKANREEKDGVLIHQLKQIKSRLLADGYPVLEVEGFEADDIRSEERRVGKEC